ncbi:alanine racemase [Frondihabitans sucicola]|uniref:Alanine racemase n=1 Tax=Frondihabitans sucicola TaxID=1268041 RepID=A0ABN6Y705_9MICO|nr:alanine racemase [Frondihabitans sucicola]
MSGPHRPESLRRPVRLEIDSDAIAANTRLIDAATNADLLAVVKGDGYGHGAETVARAAVRGGARWLGVTGVDEGLRLREAGLAVPILSWLHAGRLDVATAQAECIDVAIGSFEDLADAVRTARGLRVHVLVDTGLAREGFAESDWPRAAELLAAAERRRRIRVVGLMSHLALAEHPGDPANARQRAAFGRAQALMRSAGLAPSILHLAATAATLTAKETPGTLARVGAGLVGIDLSGTHLLDPAMTLTAPLLDVRDVAAGTASGYGHLWRADRDTRLGLVPVGYADGLPAPLHLERRCSCAAVACPWSGRCP